MAEDFDITDVLLGSFSCIDDAFGELVLVKESDLIAALIGQDALPPDGDIIAAFQIVNGFSLIGSDVNPIGYALISEGDLVSVLSGQTAISLSDVLALVGGIQLTDGLSLINGLSVNGAVSNNEAQLITNGLSIVGQESVIDNNGTFSVEDFLELCNGITLVNGSLLINTTGASTLADALSLVNGTVLVDGLSPVSYTHLTLPTTPYV